MRTSQIVHLQVSARGTTYFFSGTCRKLYTHIAFEVTRFHNMKSCSVLADNVPNEILVNVLTFSPDQTDAQKVYMCSQYFSLNYSYV